MEKFAEVFDRLGNSVVEKLNKYDVNAEVEFYPIAVMYTLDVMCGEFKSIIIFKTLLIRNHKKSNVRNSKPQTNVPISRNGHGR